MLRSPITKFRRKKQSIYDNLSKKLHKGFLQPEHAIRESVKRTTVSPDVANSTESVPNETELKRQFGEIKKHRRKRAEADILYTLTARAYDLGEYSYIANVVFGERNKSRMRIGSFVGIV